MKTTIGGDRLGAGGKESVNLKNYNRSTHNLGATWRSTMASGTLVPFMSEVALPGDKWKIDLEANVLTLPTIGPLFGSYKVQMDVFKIPMRLYNAGLQMNRLGIGMDMSKVKLPQVKVAARQINGATGIGPNSQINPSSIFKYLGISGIGGGTTNNAYLAREFNAIPYLSYWDIYKQYYANKAEERGMVIHAGDTNTTQRAAFKTDEDAETETNIYTTNATTIPTITSEGEIVIGFVGSDEPTDMTTVEIKIDGVATSINSIADDLYWNQTLNEIVITQLKGSIIGTSVLLEVQEQEITTSGEGELKLKAFPLENIDKMRDKILQHPFESGALVIDADDEAPYSLPMQGIYDGTHGRNAAYFTQEGLGLKTYQSDMFNNWMNSEWLDGTNGINEITAVSTEGDSFSIDSLNIANKVYDMLNRIAISGGSYDDWLAAVYTGDRAKAVESPQYCGSLIKELAFQEVISNSATDEEPLGSLAGRGKLTGKNKGGKMTIDIDEPSYIMGIVSLTPRVDYSNGTKFDMNLKTLDDLHKPALDGIGFQDLITTQMAWSDSVWNNTTKEETVYSAGKQPAWMNYMTDVNKCYGNFASKVGDPHNGNGMQWMTLNRDYTINQENGQIQDLTTYIDPSKFNEIFAETEIDAQNFWVQINKKITVRRKMSAKIIPNL